MSVSLQFRFMGSYPLPADLLHIFQRGAEPDRLHDRRGAGFKAMWRIVVSDVVFRHFEDHFSAPLEGTHGLQHSLAPIERADARGTVNLVACENEEVAVQVLHVNGHMDSALASIDQDWDTARMCDATDLLD